MKDKLNSLLESLDLDTLSDDENIALVEESIKNFNDIECSEFSDIEKLEAKESIDKDHITTRKILTTNINNIEKLTKIIFDQVAVDSTNIMLIQSATNVISEQSKQLKLLAELQNKMITNKILSSKADKEDSKGDKTGLPPGLSANN